MLFNTWKELVAGRLLGCVFPRGTSTWDVVWTLVQRKFVLCWLGQDKRLAQCWQLCKHPEGCEIWHRDEMENLRPLTTSWEHWQGWGNQTLRGQGSQLLQKCTFADIKSAVQAWPWNPQLLQKILIIKPSIFYPSHFPLAQSLSETWGKSVPLLIIHKTSRLQLFWTGSLQQTEHFHFSVLTRAIKTQPKGICLNISKKYWSWTFLLQATFQTKTPTGTGRSIIFIKYSQSTDKSPVLHKSQYKHCQDIEVI